MHATALATLVLRDVHQPPPPSWWPPAPGWWAVAAVVVAVLAITLAWRARRRRRQRRIAACFDAAVEGAPSPALQVEAMSELLRRAARRRDPGADRLDGDAWLSLLDGGNARRPFSQGPGRLLLDGGYRADTTQQEVDALRPLAREKFLSWMDA
ncbi:MAG: hypothetical protein A2579_13140 [Lysobacterales bacterium RIFOXYD1_FULL_69_11]|nr:MAG: hypothetical protein A2579_13140 [Xanthomonadales bacterium RIFOXYD1_FULL_69_11]